MHVGKKKRIMTTDGGIIAAATTIRRKLDITNSSFVVFILRDSPNGEFGFNPCLFGPQGRIPLYAARKCLVVFGETGRSPTVYILRFQFLLASHGR